MQQTVKAPLYGIGKAPGADAPAISVVIPMYNEEGNAQSLIREVAAALRDVAPLEVIAIDDCSRDGTSAVLGEIRGEIPELRILQHGDNAGQSRSIRTGILAARAPVIATLDGDGQNNPADIPALYARLTGNEAGDTLAMVAGERQGRQDTAAKRHASRIANGIRKKLLHDNANDTGCGLKVFYRDAYLRLPYFDHMHRYLPALVRREGFEVAFEPVSHRQRMHGQSKYTNLQRASVALRDLTGVMWLIARSRQPREIREL